MKISIVGAGISGSYLASVLSDKHDIEVFDPVKGRGCTCAWGVRTESIAKKLKHIDTDVRDYILKRPSVASINGVRKNIPDFATINKPELLSDMYSDVTRKVIRDMDDLDSDLIVNATTKPFGKCKKFGTKQFRVEVNNLDDIFYLYVHRRHIGYAWGFPLGNNVFHIGAGGFGVDPRRMIYEFIDFYDVDVVNKLCGCEKDINLPRPGNTVTEGANKVSIGEAAGFTHPLTGEGIESAIGSAIMLRDSIKRKDDVSSILESYESSARRYLLSNNYDRGHKIVEFAQRSRTLGWLAYIAFLARRAGNRVNLNPTFGEWKDFLSSTLL